MSSTTAGPEPGGLRATTVAGPLELERPAVAATRVEPRAASRAWLRAVVALAILCGIFFRLYHIDRKTYWEDELLGTIHTLGYTEAEIVAASPGLHDAAAVQSYFRLPVVPRTSFGGLGATVQSLALEDPQHPPVFYVLSRMLVGAAGSSVLVLRALPVLFGLLALPAMFWFALEAFGSRSLAWLSVALLAVSPFQVLYSQEAREYTLWSVTILVSSALLLRAVRTGSRFIWLSYAASLVVGLYVFPLSVLVIAGHAAYVFAGGAMRKRGTALWFLASVAVAGACFAPWLRIMLASRGLQRGMDGIFSAKLGLLTISFDFMRDLKSGLFDFGFFRIDPLHSAAINAAFLAVAVALLGFAAYTLARRGGRNAASFVLVGLTLPGVILIGHDLLSGGNLVQQGRYFMPVYLAGVVALAFLFDVKMRRAPAAGAWPAVFVFVLFGGVVSCLVSANAPTWSNKDFERTPEVAAAIDAAGRPLVVSDRASTRALDLSYYLRPDVALRLHLQCEQCTNAPAPEPNLLAGSGRFSDVFVVGPYGGPGTLSSVRYRAIGIKTFPHDADPLNMFLSVR